MVFLAWIAWFSSFLLFLMIGALLFKFVTGKSNEFKFQKISSPEGKYYNIEEFLGDFGEKVSSELSDSEIKKIQEEARETLVELKKEGVLDKVDVKLLEKIINSKRNPDIESVLLDYLSHKGFLLRYSNYTILDLYQDYSNLFIKMGQMCKSDFKEISFETGILIDGEEVMNFNDFLPSFNQHINTGHPFKNYHPRKKNLVRLKVDIAVDKFNQILENEEKEKRFFYDVTTSFHHTGVIWYGKQEHIQEIVKELDLKAELYKESAGHRRKEKVEPAVETS